MAFVTHSVYIAELIKAKLVEAGQISSLIYQF